MAANWRGPQPLIDDIESVFFDLVPYRHWLHLPQPTIVSAGDPGCPPQPKSTPAPFVLTMRRRDDVLIERAAFFGALQGAYKQAGLGDTPDFLFRQLYRDLEDGQTGTMTFFATEEQYVLFGREMRARMKPEDILTRITASGLPLPPGVTPATDWPDGQEAWGGQGPAKMPERVVAVVDADMPFLHDRLRTAGGGTRLMYYWNQDPPPGQNALTNQTMLVGRELYRDEIAGMLGQMAKGNLSEAEMYRRVAAVWYGAGVVPLPPRVLSHGAHVLDLAAGHAPSVPDVPPVFAVALPRRVLGRTNGAFLFPYLLLAIERICDRARALAIKVEGTADAMPKIHLNLSLGSLAGRHDGLSQIERYLDSVAARPEIAVVSVAAGNANDVPLPVPVPSRRPPRRYHARLSPAQLEDAGTTLEWQIEPDDGTENILQIWLPESAVLQKTLTLTITPPGALHVGSFQFSDPHKRQYFEFADGCDVLARLYQERDRWFDFPPLGGPFLLNPRTEITLIVRHTAPQRQNRHFSRGRPDLAGRWKLTLTGGSGLLAADEELAIWVERDDPLAFLPLGARQSYLVPKDGVTRTDGTIGDLSTGRRTIVVAAHIASTGQMSEYSGAGLTFSQNGQQEAHDPSVSVPGDASPVLRGLRAAGYFSGSARRYAGTSMSAAVLTRFSYGAGKPPVGTNVKPHVESLAVADEPPNPPADMSRRGNGRLTRILPPRG